MPELRGGRTDPLERIPSVKRAIPSFIFLGSGIPCVTLHFIHFAQLCMSVVLLMLIRPPPSSFMVRQAAMSSCRSLSVPRHPLRPSMAGKPPSLDKPNPNLNTALPPTVNCRSVPHRHTSLSTQPPTLPPSSPPFGITPTTTLSHSDFTLGSARRRKKRGSGPG
jgi:hypothetical protein